MSQLHDEEMRIDVEAVRRLIEAYPDDFARFREEALTRIEDKFGRVIAINDRVVTPQEEVGRVIRLDRKSRRVLIELPGGNTRMLMAHRLEVKRGRPRKTASDAA